MAEEPQKWMQTSLQNIINMDPRVKDVLASVCEKPLRDHFFAKITLHDLLQN